MAKSTIGFVCAECGYETGKWMGKCPACGNWNTLTEVEKVPKEATATPKKIAAESELLKDVKADNARRWKTGMAELDRVLGGGLVRGGTVLLGGDPGIGKSTLLLQVCDELSKHATVLYATGEESAAQIRLRAQRLGVVGKHLYVLAENALEGVLDRAKELNCTALVVDSIQTVYSGALSTAAGSVSQIRQATASLTRLAKDAGVTVIIVGHVTKEGAIAGPKLLEHLVDTVLYFEGDRADSFRILRAVKNRYGSTNEIGVFSMGERGMAEIEDPSALFLPDREKSVPGCAPMCVIEGSRPVMVELQALVTKTVFGMPRRMAAGLDYNRLALLIAVLEKKLGLAFGDQDAFVNIVGGLKVDDRAADLAVVCALCSSLRNLPLPAGCAVLGEIGLTGEVRAVSAAEKRAAECA
ncbi:MAG: DNA repair protein RadA, partial [Christensenellales bacterium]